MQADRTHESAAAGADPRMRIPIFDGNDFGLWRMRAEGALMAVDLLDTVETTASSTSESTDTPSGPTRHQSQGKKKGESNAATTAEREREDTVRRSHRAYGMLVQALQDEQLRLMSTVQRGDARALWRVLLDTYDRKSMATRVQLLEQLFAFQLLRGETIAAYVARLMEMERKLKEQDEPVSESILAYVLLRGLPDAYASTVQWIKLQQDTVELQDIIESIRNEEERQRTGTLHGIRGAGTPAHGAHAATNGPSAVCYTCGKPGHKKFDCPSNADRKKCSNCKRVGHSESECRHSTHKAHTAVHYAS